VDVASEDPVLGDNLAYTVHFYAASMGADLRGKVSTALANGVAIFATEWGTCEYTGDGRLDLDESQAWQDFMEENHISDSNWAVSNKEESCSALRGGASGSGGWSEGDLTESGAWVRNSIQQYNSDEPLATVSAASPAASSGQFEAVLMKKHSLMRGPVRSTGDSISGWPTAAVAWDSNRAAHHGLLLHDDRLDLPPGDDRARRADAGQRLVGVVLPDGVAHPIARLRQVAF
jgi:hypothetical protein